MTPWRVHEALTSVRRFIAIADKMTSDEVRQAITIEEAGLRRKSLLDRLKRLARKHAVAQVMCEHDSNPF